MPQSDAEAARLFGLAADQGFADGQNNLGCLYEIGRGVPQSDAEAIRLFRLAAAQGHAAAQVNLGALYLQGRGVPQSDAEAARLLRLAADQGFAPALNSLGVLYETGRGVPQSYQEAAQLYKAVVDQGSSEGQDNLIFFDFERRTRQNSGSSPQRDMQDGGVPGEPTTPVGAAGRPRPQSALPAPEAAGHELTRQKKSVATHYRLDAEELHLSAMAAVAGSEVAARAVSADPEELRELRDVRRLWNLRLDLHQKSKVAAGFPELLNEAQYRFAKSLEKTANEIRTLEVKLFGPDRVSEKGEIVSEIKRRASDYEYEPKRVRPRRERNSSSQLLRKVNG